MTTIKIDHHQPWRLMRGQKSKTVIRPIQQPRVDYFSFCPAHRSPNQFHRKLYLPRRRLGRGDEPCIRYAVSRRIENISVVQGRCKIRVVQDVEKLGAKLRIEAIGDPFDVVVLEDGEIEVNQSGSDKCVSAQVSAECNRIWDREALRLDVADGITRIHWRTATWTGNQVGNIDIRICAFHSERVPSKTGSERYSGASFEYSSYLPSSQQPRFAS